MASRKILTMCEIINMIEDDDDDSIENVCVVPPDALNDITDEEYIDEDDIPFYDNQTALQELAGTFEVNRRNDDETSNIIPCEETEIEVEQPSTSSKAVLPPKRMKKTYKPLSAFGEPKWSKRRNRSKIFEFNLTPDTEPLTALQQKLFDEIKDLSCMQLFERFFDQEMLELIIKESNTYAQQKLINLTLDEHSLKRFMGILILSGYNTLPSINDYWSSDPCLGNAIVKQSMSRKKFKEIKQIIHFNNNTHLDQSDKLWKVRPLFEMANKNFIQFGVWSENLSIDEQMVPYFGRHSCKMFIRNKPIRFGYKIWCLCSASGYLYSCIPYSGASDKYDRQVGLGADVVMRLLEKVKHPNQYKVYFDNFFTSYYLMCLLTEKRFCATGTVRSNRIANAPLQTGKQLKRGETDYQFDTTNGLLICRWADNKEVTIFTNFDQIEPTHNVKRWKKEEKKYINYQQPSVINNYNNGMGGVDLHDNAVQNYRINIRSKKWYWPLFLAVLSSSIVNAWKLHCFIAKFKHEKVMSQKTFRVDISKQLLLTSDDLSSEGSSTETYQPRNMPRISGKHIPVVQPEGKPRRCQLKGCGKPIKWMCKKCNVHLHPKCFEKYHKK